MTAPSLLCYIPPLDLRIRSLVSSAFPISQYWQRNVGLKLSFVARKPARRPISCSLVEAQSAVLAQDEDMSALVTEARRVALRVYLL